MECPYCQTENPEGVKFCGECGRSISLELTCPQCGHKNPQGVKFCHECGHSLAEKAPKPKKPSTIEPTSFADGRYQVKKFLGEGGKKKVYLAHDTKLDRDVAFALIKTENMDDSGRKRVSREARAMGRLSDHPNIVTIHEMGEHEGQPYIVQPVMASDIEELIEKAPEHKLPIEQVISIAKAVCQGLVFSHSKGIIHRDLKPGNVMLTEDGTAKIGDFGLAVAIDLSRLTQSGVMVGTCSYMPPEQTMGGKVTAQADLYSLGAMLYEMVAGRPPFVGDDSVSIIGQHLNTPPVSPTWHRADLPPALETLILQLLEKDPTKRPSSAADVLQALESIDTGKLSKEVSKEASTVAENPLYRRVFVGREPELKQLQSAFDGAFSGQGALMTVVGEPGIGKTALVCEQFKTWVTLRGGKTLVGHCYEEGSLSLPYLAFVEAMRSYVLDRNVKDLREELGTGAADVARIVSEIREKLKVKPRPKGDPEEERYRLMQAVTTFLTNAASVQPLLVVLEDLHDSDKGTLDMLTHISRHLAGTRLLLIGTYRDVEVDRTHPLSAALAELRRVSSYDRVLLRGLNADEVKRMLESITREEIPWSLAEAVHRQTEGNPLFVQEVVRYLVEEGLLTQKEGRWQPTKDTPLEMSIPEGLRDVIGKRLSLLSQECNQLLSIAAVIGREFTLETLRAVAGIDEKKFVDALKEAVQLSILEERSQVGVIRYRFTHAFFRQTLYEELIAPQRLQFHQQIARSLEKQYTERLEEHAAELAEHFSHSTDPADLKKAVEYGEMAAKRATDVYAYGEAVRLLDQAVKVQKVLNPDAKEKACDLLISLCEVLFHAGDVVRVSDVEAPAAFSLAESIGDGSRAARACIWAINSVIVLNTDQLFAHPQVIEWAERADRNAPSGTSERCITDAMLGYSKYQKGDIHSGHILLHQAFDLARKQDDQMALTVSTQGILFFERAPKHAMERVQMAEEFLGSIHAGTKNIWNQYGLQWVVDAFLSMGQRQRAEEVISDIKALAIRTKILFLEFISAAFDEFPAVMDGRLNDVISMVENTQNRGKEAGVAELANTYSAFAGIRARLYLGTSIETLEDEVSVFAVSFEPVLCVVLAHLGRKEEASEMLQKYVVNRPGVGTLEDATGAGDDILYLEASVLVGHRQAAELLMNRFKDSEVCTPGLMQPTCLARHLGGAAALLGRDDEARKYYQEAINVCTEMPFRPELALSRLQLAELLLEHYPTEKKEALEHLDFAIKEFREMKMQPSLERALRHKDILKA